MLPFPPPLSLCFLPTQSDMQQLLQMFAQAVSTWRSMAANGASLDYPSAAEMILSSEAMSKQFLQQARKVNTHAACLLLHQQPHQARLLPPQLMSIMLSSMDTTCALQGGFSLSAACCSLHVMIVPVCDPLFKLHGVPCCTMTLITWRNCCVLCVLCCLRCCWCGMAAAGDARVAATPLCGTQQGTAVAAGADDLQHQCQCRAGGSPATIVPTVQKEGQGVVVLYRMFKHFVGLSDSVHVHVHGCKKVCLLFLGYSS